MPVFIACLENEAEISAVISPDNDMAREMIKQKLIEDQRYLTLGHWETSGMRVKLQEKGYRGDPPHSLF